VLAERLRKLERSQIIERQTGPTGRTIRYQLTPAGRDLQPVLDAVGQWAATWAFTDPRSEELDADLLMVWIARHVDHAQLPAERTVVQFDLRDPTKRYWLVLEPAEVSVCLQHPGFDPHLTLSADTATMYHVYLGQTELSAGLRARTVKITGSEPLRRALTRWFTWSSFAPASRTADKRRQAAVRLHAHAASRPQRASPATTPTQAEPRSRLSLPATAALANRDPRVSPRGSNLA